VSFPRVGIVGIHRTRQARVIEQDALTLILEAGLGAVADAGLTLDDIDGISARWPGPGGTVMHPGSADWASLLRRPLRWIGDTYPAGVPFLLDAAAAIEAGLCHTVLTMGGQTGVNNQGLRSAAYTVPDNEFTGPVGSFTAAQFALVAQRYYHRFRPDVEKIAGVAAAIRNMGSLNPEAVMFGRGPYSAADVLASPMIADPFHLLELCLTNDGAAAVVITSLERARGCRHVPVQVLGGGAEWYRQQYVDSPRYEEVGRIGSDAAARAFGQAGVGIGDIDVLSLHDATVFELIRQLEVLGFCGEGEGPDFATERGIGLGKLAVNLDGGLLSFSHTGWSTTTLRIVDAVEQLRGDAGPRQVEGARLAVISGAGSGAQYYNMAVLGRE
jgi:acetyl-CoA acetyltransferase